ncbi:hypothetical protein C8R43DRAFT_1025015 [Mycena crocata]|nr:hypothetical protein C8R43DRAFT_1025015 [Mycena crocata]
MIMSRDLRLSFQPLKFILLLILPQISGMYNIDKAVPRVQHGLGYFRISRAGNGLWAVGEDLCRGIRRLRGIARNAGTGN